VGKTGYDGSRNDDGRIFGPIVVQVYNENPLLFFRGSTKAHSALQV